MIIPVLAPAVCNLLYSQCDGENFTGPKCCVEGTVCKFVDRYYSQCLPDTGAPKPTSTVQPPQPSPTSVPPVSPPTNGPSGLGSGFWTARGKDLFDSQGRLVKMAGVNWFGAETAFLAPHGLWQLNYKSVLRDIASKGYNTIRYPFSNDIVRNPFPGEINYFVNPDLRGKRALEIMDLIIEYAGQVGLKILLDRHRPDSNGQSNLWYTDKVPESQWIEDWVILAQRYKGNPTVIGADLHNEPHGEACWGCGDIKLDWRLAAERCGNAILAVEPNWLIVVEGVEFFEDTKYWWGGNLAGVAKYPVRLSNPAKLVYSTHEYSKEVFNQPWFSDPTFPNNLAPFYDKIWGFIVKQKTAPVLVGEFGAKLNDITDRPWMSTLVAYMKDLGISWTYWCWNPNSVDTGGLLADDWTTFRADKDLILAPGKLILDGMPKA